MTGLNRYLESFKAETNHWVLFKNPNLNSYSRYQVEVERAQIYQARAELKLWVSSPNEPETVKIALELASSSNLFTNKNAKIWIRVFWKIRPAEPWAWTFFLQVPISTQASGPEPRLVPPSVSSASAYNLNLESALFLRKVMRQNRWP